MKKKNFAGNMFFAILLQFTTLIFPLITAPYVSSVLGAENLGKVNFSFSIATWFAVFAAFGTLTYGVKEVAKIKDDKEKLSKFFSELMAIKIIVTVLVIIIYIPAVMVIPRFSEDFWLFIVQGSVLILNIFSLDWFFQGVEDYKYITIRSLIFKIISLAAIFLMIKQRADYILYAAISIVALSASNILNFFYSRKHVNLSFKQLKLKRHLKPLTIFFISAFVTSLYGIFDQILLGFFLGDIPVAFFVRAKAINGIGLGIILTISNVFLPRLNNYFIKYPERYKELLKISLNLLLTFAFPLALGLILLAPNLMILFGGSQFEDAAILLQIIAFTAIIVSVGTWNYQQRLIPLGLEKYGLLFQVIMAVVSLTLNLILLNTIGLIGVAIAWISAELIGDIVGFIFTKKKDNFTFLNFDQIKIIIATALMAGFVFLLNSILALGWLNLFLIIGTSAVLYFLLLFIMREKTLILVLKEGKKMLFAQPTAEGNTKPNETNEKSEEKKNEK